MTGSAAATLLVFWDYDTQWGADVSRNPHGGNGWGGLDFENTERLLDLHAEFGVPACFAVVGAAALPGVRPYHDPAQIRRIHAAGHEVASHSFRHEWLPGLGYGGLLDTLRRSKDALEQCVGAGVTTFVPPYNQPFDYARGWAFSLSERLAVARDRVDLSRLCGALRDTGYLTCRVRYETVLQKLLRRVSGRVLHGPARAQSIGSITCIRLNTPCGFSTRSRAVVARCLRRGGVVAVYGHPHSLHAGNTQDEHWLVPFLRQVRALRDRGRLRICVPRQLDSSG